MGLLWSVGSQDKAGQHCSPSCEPSGIVTNLSRYVLQYVCNCRCLQITSTLFKTIPFSNMNSFTYWVVWVVLRPSPVSLYHYSDLLVFLSLAVEPQLVLPTDPAHVILSCHLTSVSRGQLWQHILSARNSAKQLTDSLGLTFCQCDSVSVYAESQEALLWLVLYAVGWG